MVEVTHCMSGVSPQAWSDSSGRYSGCLEKYVIASDIDVSELKQDDFDTLETLGLKPFV